tara:strand:- start:5499 stop:5738 length:240 start_codon:yes stop_codon:yes gene_type:complete
MVEQWGSLWMHLRVASKCLEAPLRITMVLTMAFHAVVAGLSLEFENEIKTSRIEAGVSRLHREFLAPWPQPQNNFLQHV